MGVVNTAFMMGSAPLAFARVLAPSVASARTERP